MTITLPTFTLTLKGIGYSVALFTIGFSRNYFDFHFLPFWKEDYQLYEQRSMFGVYIEFILFTVWLQAGYRRFNSIQLPRPKPKSDELPF